MCCEDRFLLGIFYGHCMALVVVAVDMVHGYCK